VGTTPIRVVVAARTGLRTRLVEGLSAAGIEVAADCGSVTELVAAVSTARPDVCVLDSELQGGGLTATAAISSPRRAPKVIVVGGGGSPSERRAARLAGAADCLPGEIDPAAIAAAVVASTRTERRGGSRQ
jgi:DNA-binding NarL/FixJ family response regulator